MINLLWPHLADYSKVEAELAESGKQFCVVAGQ